ncbi:MAG: LysE family transporter, partial [Proteobacteria bacterium]|nr:LysE family transporter [Pseudomonadota bacterium]
ILALGAQNIFVLNSGLRKQRFLLVALVSSVCDTILVFVGVLGVATFLVKLPFLKIGLGIVGVGFLFYYGVTKLREAKSGVNISSDSGLAISVKQAVLTSMGFSLLNPHVYLDTVVLFILNSLVLCSFDTCFCWKSPSQKFQSHAWHLSCFRHNSHCSRCKAGSRSYWLDRLSLRNP